MSLIPTFDELRDAEDDKLFGKATWQSYQSCVAHDSAAATYHCIAMLQTRTERSLATAAETLRALITLQLLYPHAIQRRIFGA